MGKAATYTNWRKSARSSGDDNCVEVAFASDGGAGRIGMRDSKQRGRGPVLEFTVEQWAAFLDGVRRSGAAQG